MVKSEEKDILQILEDLKKITSLQAKELRSLHRLEAEAQALQKGWISQEDLHKARAIYFHIDTFDQLLEFSPPEHVCQQIPYSFAKKHVLVPLFEKEESIHIAISDPLNLHAIEELRHYTGKDIQAACAPQQAIFQLIGKAYDNPQSTASDLIATLSPSSESKSSSEGSYDLLDLKDEAPIIQLLNAIISEAVQQEASDIHFEPFENDLLVRYRIDGVLHSRHSPPQEYQAQLITRIKVMAQLDIAERRLPQDGRIKLHMGNREIDFRVSTVPVVNGERIVLRILDKGNISLGLEKIGMTPELLKSFQKQLSLPEGIILVTGPTGSGKTTTLYSAIQDIRNDESNIMTIEDPVEYKLPGIAQISVKPKINLNFATGLRHILRQDPDVILVGEIRDKETAEIALQASLTGHLVLSTLHTNDAPSAITRLVDMGIEPYLLSSTVVGILAQRLLRKICPHCIEPYLPSQQELKKIGLEEKHLKDGFLFKGSGCSHCFGSGYKGRHAIYELMPISNKVRSQLAKEADALSLRNIAISEGMTSLQHSGALLVQQGVTTVQEVLRVTRNSSSEE